MDTQLAPLTPHSLSDAQFAALSAIPPETEWFANLRNRHTREHYQRDITQFLTFAGIGSTAQLRQVTRPHLLAWRDHLHGQGWPTIPSGANSRRCRPSMPISVNAMPCWTTRCWASGVRPR
jgi:hypothetical protein